MEHQYSGAGCVDSNVVVVSSFIWLGMLLLPVINHKTEYSNAALLKHLQQVVCSDLLAGDCTGWASVPGDAQFSCTPTNS